MKEISDIEFRVQFSAPIVSGLFYARLLDDERIDPVEVFEDTENGNELFVYVFGNDCSFNIEDFTWFGPVREVRESGDKR